MKYHLTYVKASLGNNPHYFSPHDATAPSGPGRHYRGFTIILRHITLGKDPLDGWSAQRRGLYLYNTQHSQQTDIHASGGILKLPQPSHTETPTHIETRTHNQSGDTIEKSQAHDDGCINVRNTLSTEEV